MTFLTIVLASFIGGTLGQALVLYIVGGMAKRVEEEKAKILEQAIREHQDALLREQKRMREYVKMEG